MLLIKVARLRGNRLGRRCKRQALTASQFAWEDLLPGLRVGVGLGLSGELLFNWGLKIRIFSSGVASFYKNLLLVHTFNPSTQAGGSL